MSQVSREITNTGIPTTKQNEPHSQTELLEIPEQLKEKARVELGETEEKLANCIKTVREGIHKCELPFPDDDENITPFIRARKFDCKRAIDTIKAFTVVMKDVMRKYGPPEAANVVKALKTNAFGVLPCKDEQERSIIYWRAGPKMRKGLEKRDAIHAILVSMFLLANNPIFQICGFLIIIDFDSMTFYDIPYELDLLRTVLPILRCDPARFQKVHVVNEGTITGIIIGFAKLLLPAKLAKRIKFHGSKMEELHKFLSPDILPEEFGGTLGPISNDHWIEAVVHTTARVKEQLLKYYS